MKPLITIVATAHLEKPYNRVFIDSILNQTNTNWKAVLFHNGPNYEFTKKLINYDDRFFVHCSNADNGNWGTANRQSAIGICDTEYIINTSIQDYYLPTFIEEVTRALVNKPDIVTWPGLNHLFNYDIVPGELAWGKIDWGNFCVKTEHIRKFGVIKGSEFCSDWFTVEKMINEGLLKNRVHIPKILTIHN